MGWCWVLSFVLVGCCWWVRKRFQFVLGWLVPKEGRSCRKRVVFFEKKLAWSRGRWVGWCEETIDFACRKTFSFCQLWVLIEVLNQWSCRDFKWAPFWGRDVFVIVSNGVPSGFQKTPVDGWFYSCSKWFFKIQCQTAGKSLNMNNCYVLRPISNNCNNNHKQQWQKTKPLVKPW